MSTKAQISKLKKLLLSRDWEQIRQGVELVVGIDDPEVWDVMLDGVAFESPSTRPPLTNSRKDKGSETIGRIVPSTLFQQNRNSLLWDELATAHLLARSSHPVRNEVTALSMMLRVQLDGLDGFENLQKLSIEVHGQETNFAPLTKFPRLSSLELRQLDHVHRQDPSNVLATLDDLAHLEVLDLGQNCRVTLRNLPSLQHVTSRSDFFDCTVQKKVKELHLQTLTDEAIRTFPNIDRLVCNSVRVMQEEFPRCELVVDPHGSQTKSIRVLGGSLSSISNISGVQRISMLGLNYDGTFLIDVAPLRTCADLRVLDVRKNAAVTGLEGLEGHPSLRMIAAHNSNISKDSVPASMKKVVSFAANPDLDKASDRPAPNAKKTRAAAVKAGKLTPEAKKAVSRLRKLLTTPDATSIMQGVELAASLADPAIFSALLDGVEYTEADAEMKEGARTHVVPVEGRLIPNKIFTGSGSRQHWLDLAVALLVAASDLPLRDEIEGLSLGQRYYSQTPIDKNPIGGLAWLPNLERFELHLHRGGEADLISLTGFPALKKLAVYGGYLSHEPVPSIDGLEHLKLSGRTLQTDGIWPELRSLDLVVRTTRRNGKAESSPARISGASFPKLETLSGSGDMSLIDLPTLNTVSLKSGQITISSCPEMRELSGDSISLNQLEDVPSLATVRLRQSNGPSWESASTIPSIELFSVQNVRSIATTAAPPNASTDQALTVQGNIEDLGNLGSLGNLQQLTIVGQTEPLSLDSLSEATQLRVLDIRGCTGIDSLEDLFELDELRMIAIKRSGVEVVPPELKHVVSLAAQPNLVNAFDKAKPKRRKTKSTIPVTEELRGEWDRVEAGLATAKLETAMTAIETAIGLGPEAVEFLLGKVKVDGARVRARAPFRFDTPWMAAPAVSRLLQSLPEESKVARALKAMPALLLLGRRLNGDSVTTGDLSGFGAVKHLTVENCASPTLTDLDETRIETLVVRALHRVSIDGALPESLTKALFHRCHPNLLTLAKGSLTELYLLESPGLDLSELAEATTLTHLHITLTPYSNRAQVDNLGALLGLPLVELTLSAKVDLAPLSGHPTLQKINIWNRHAHKERSVPP